MKRLLFAGLTSTILILGSLGIQPSSADVYPLCTITQTSTDRPTVGTEGDDVICAIGGSQQILGMGGNDIIIATAPGSYFIDGGFGNDIIDARLASKASVYGGWGDDTIYGSPGDDVLGGGAGDDIVYGYNGNDDISEGGDGKNTFYGGEGNDTITGGDGDETFYGESGYDLIHGNGGNDIISGGDNPDQLYGEFGTDIIDGDSGDDSLYGDFGGSSGGQNDVLRGGAGEDNLVGGGGNDTIQGGDGNDRLTGGEGIDIQQGGSGANTCDFDFGEPKDKFCTFPKEDPMYSEWIAQKIDISDAPVTLSISLRTAEVDGYKDFVLSCGAASSKIDFISKQITDFKSATPNQPLTTPVLLSNGYFVSFPLTFPKGFIGGEYQCNSVVRDNFGNSFTKAESKIAVHSTPDGVPSAPSSLTFTWISPSAGTLSWTEPSFTGTPKFTQYQAQFSQNGGGFADFYNGKTKNTSLGVTQLDPKSTYSYRVRAINTLTSGRSTAYMTINWSQMIVQPSTAKKILAPTKVKISSITSSGATLTWAKPAGTKKITNYLISYSSDGKTWTAVSRTVSPTPTQFLQGLLTKTQYVIRVAAVSGTESGYETYVTFVTS